MTDDPSGQTPERSEGDEGAAIGALTEKVLPALIARLRASRLGELEVRSDGWRVRLRREAPSTNTATVAGAASAESQVVTESMARDQEVGVARSPAVGYFTPDRDLAMGRSVQAGDSLGTVDVLGIVQDVAAPTDGVISRVLAEAGQAVEYGQALANIDPLGAVGADGVADAPDGDTAALAD